MTVLLAMLLDALFGEPKWVWDRIPHPAVLIGRVIGWADKRFNSGGLRRAKGVGLLIALVAGGALAGVVIEALLGPVAVVLVGAILLAQRSLADHVRDVADALRVSLGDGRMMVARIVGRDTAEMDEPAVARAAIESAAENFSDGVIAPLFWFLVAGLPGLIVYKAVNTADSMVGYRTPRHEDFGWAAARFDDLLNWVPARITALLILVVTGKGRWADITADARRHRSPNAGWPEAAFARGLNVALAGPRSYHGSLSDDPFVNPEGKRVIGADEIIAAVRLLWRVWLLVAVLVGLLALF
ncbi:adenosylcobinamide-phosphate synthase CbiB [Pelagovum sp. HNIBRBA483]|uniref:adenosylcobinamide-phosphate synthase CbiB n=1 Tax=Pelagovum sp. HNIBRBA483 TaxID=3233341 RepID=UPI0034A1E1A0